VRTRYMLATLSLQEFCPLAVARPAGPSRLYWKSIDFGDGGLSDGAVLFWVESQTVRGTSVIGGKPLRTW